MSVSFSALETLLLRWPCGISCGYWFVLRLDPAGGLFRADSGWEVWPEGGVLIDACAVFEDMDEVGRPDEKIDRFGLLKRPTWEVEWARS